MNEWNIYSSSENNQKYKNITSLKTFEPHKNGSNISSNNLKI